MLSTWLQQLFPPQSFLLLPHALPSRPPHLRNKSREQNRGDRTGWRPWLFAFPCSYVTCSLSSIITLHHCQVPSSTSRLQELIARGWRTGLLMGGRSRASREAYSVDIRVRFSFIAFQFWDLDLQFSVFDFKLSSYFSFRFYLWSVIRFSFQIFPYIQPCLIVLLSLPISLLLFVLAQP